MIANDRQIEITRRKLAHLEEGSSKAEERLRAEPDRDAARVTLRSYRQLIRQLREEISRYEVGVRAAPSRNRLTSDEQLRNTVEKLRQIDGLVQNMEAAASRGKSTESELLSLCSLRQVANQLSEEITRFEIERGQPVASTSER